EGRDEGQSEAHLNAGDGSQRRDPEEGATADDEECQRYCRALWRAVAAQPAERPQSRHHGDHRERQVELAVSAVEDHLPTLPAQRMDGEGERAVDEVCPGPLDVRRSGTRLART